MPTTEDSEGERGFALIIVISVLAVLAVLATGFAVATRQQANVTRNTIATARARALADAGVSLAIARVITRDPATRWSADGQLRTLLFGGGKIRVSVQDEAGKIDLNWAPAPVIEGLLAELSGDAEQQSGIASEILARRDTARLPSVPPGEMMGAALLGGPRLRDLAGAPFRSVDELLTLPSMTRAIYARLRPFVTVYAQSAHVNPATASREVLLAIPGLSPATVALVLAARTRGQADLPIAQPDLAGARQFLAVLDTRTVTITAQAGAAPGTNFVREAVAAATSDPYHPFRILEWRQDLRATGPTTSLSAIPPR